MEVAVHLPSEPVAVEPSAEEVGVEVPLEQPLELEEPSFHSLPRLASSACSRRHPVFHLISINQKWLTVFLTFFSVSKRPRTTRILSSFAASSARRERRSERTGSTSEGAMVFSSSSELLNQFSTSFRISTLFSQRRLKIKKVANGKLGGRKMLKSNKEVTAA